MSRVIKATFKYGVFDTRELVKYGIYPVTPEDYVP